MEIVIVGGGAIGRLFSCLLAKGGHQVTLVDSDQRVVDGVRGAGLGLMELEETNPDLLSRYPVQAVSDPSSLSGCDLVLLAVKSYATLAATRSIAHLVSEQTPVLSLQTGLGNLETMAKVVDEQNIIGGFTFMSATSLGYDRVRHGGMGKTYIGELNGTFTPALNRSARPSTAVV